MNESPTLRLEAAGRCCLCVATLAAAAVAGSQLARSPHTTRLRRRAAAPQAVHRAHVHASHNHSSKLPALARPNVTQFEHEGYVVVEGVFDAAEIDELRARIQKLKREATQFGPSKALKTVDPGLTIPDFAARPAFAFMHHLPTHSRILRSLHHVFRGAAYRYCSHNDIGINRIVSWHKDKLNDQYQHYQKLPLWPERPLDGGHMIVKVLIYLQGHEHDDHGLLLVPGSYGSPSYETSRTRRMHPPKGSIVIFEQRTTHRGLSIAQGMAHHLASASDDRLLVSLGYGLHNAHTAEFEAGTRARQSDQCGTKCVRTAEGPLDGPPRREGRGKPSASLADHLQVHGGPRRVPATV